MDLETLIPSFGAVGAIAIAFRAMFIAEGTNAELKGLARQVGALGQRLGQRDEPIAGAAAVEAPAEPASEPKSPAASSGKPSEEHPEPAGSEAPLLQSQAASPPQGQTAPPAVNGAQLERLLVENWLVWVGGLALALGGAFLVKLSIDHNLLTPVVRVVLGVLLGLTMSGAAEWLARRDHPDLDETMPSYVPQALAAAGAVSIFASLYAAHRLYALLPEPLAFVLLATTAAATVVSSLRHGKFVAALGLVGAFTVPILVKAKRPMHSPSSVI
jgi:uncharacterized membrane protein